MRPLCAELSKIAREELNETPDRIAQDLVILREWLKQQTHIKARSTDEFLIAFLRRCRYSLEETKTRLENYYRYYAMWPSVMRNRAVTEKLLDFNRTGYLLFQ